MSTFFVGPDLALPWSASESDDNRFFKVLGVGLVVFFIFSVLIPLLPVKEISRAEQEALPPQLARVIMEKKELPPVEKPKPKEKEPEKPKEEKPEEKPKPEAKPPEPEPEAIEKAKQQAQVSGVLAFQDDLLEMRESLDLDSLGPAPVTDTIATAAKVERSIITGKAKAGSGGIATAALSTSTGGAALSGRETSRVQDEAAIEVAEQKARDATVKVPGRSDEAVRRIMDRNKGAIFSIYNRALRKDPTLEGRFVFEMLIAPSGAITNIKLISSELGDEALNRKILSRVKLINFGADKVTATTVNYSFDFVPY